MSPAQILVVDDERDIRELLKEILVDEGYEGSVAENGETARLARRARRPDLVLLDIWMPDVDGISLLKEWNDERGPSAPVIMMSGHGTVETAVEATRLGAYDFIEKPLSMARLLVTIARARGRPSRARESGFAQIRAVRRGAARQERGDAATPRTDAARRATRRVGVDPRRTGHGQGT